MNKLVKLVVIFAVVSMVSTGSLKIRSKRQTMCQDAGTASDCKNALDSVREDVGTNPSQDKCCITLYNTFIKCMKTAGICEREKSASCLAENICGVDGKPDLTNPFETIFSAISTSSCLAPAPIKVV